MGSSKNQEKGCMIAFIAGLPVLVGVLIGISLPNNYPVYAIAIGFAVGAVGAIVYACAAEREKRQQNTPTARYSQSNPSPDWHDPVMEARRARQAKRTETVFLGIGCASIVIIGMIVFLCAIFSGSGETLEQKEEKRIIYLKAALQETDPEKQEKLFNAFEKTSDDLLRRRQK